MTGRQNLLGIVIAAALGLLVLALPAAASARDRNHDNIPDRWERNHSLSLKVNQAQRDQDRDALVNRQEFRSSMDPHDADSDNDGVEDGDEGAGTVVSFDESTGQLTIDDMNGGSVTGLVTDETEISCDDGDDHGDEDADHEGGDDDHSGPGGDDDHSGPGGGDDDADEEDDEHECSTADLVPGAIVQEAELELTVDGFVWEEVELLE